MPKGILRYMSTTNDTTMLSLKTKKEVKELAQMRAKQLGIPHVQTLGALQHLLRSPKL